LKQPRVELNWKPCDWGSPQEGGGRRKKKEETPGENGGGGIFCGVKPAVLRKSKVKKNGTERWGKGKFVICLGWVQSEHDYLTLGHMKGKAPT